LLGSGTLFAQASLLLGPAFRAIELTVIPDYGGFLLMILPPGGFLVLGLLLAGKRALELRAREANAAVAPAPALA
jgi:electron transport complex protein RnfE